MANYKITIKNPKSDNDNKVEGLISFIELGTTISSVAILNNLPNPFINLLTGLPVDNNTGKLEYKGKPFANLIPLNILIDDVITNLKIMVISKYGLFFDLIYEEIIVNPTEPIPSLTQSTPTTNTIFGTGSTPIVVATSSTATASQPREYTFDVQIKDTFYNADIGFLTITGKVDDTFVYGDEQDTIDPEYLEEPFVGEEEQLITLEAINVEALNDIKGFDPENPDPVISTDAGSPYPIPKNKQANISAIVAAMKRHKITNKYTQAAILAIVSKESAFVPRNEGSYAKTSATRIKSIFAAFRKYSDSEVDRIKKIPKQFFDIIYGGKNGNAADEGYKYRGRGFNQLTFKGLYLEAQNKTGHKIVADPDLLNTIEVASDCIVVYFLQRMAGMPSKYRTQYNTSGAINDFKTLNDAVGAIYHANAGWGHSYSLIVADSTGGRRKAFAAAPSLYSNLA
jgi:putative chitinase